VIVELPTLEQVAEAFRTNPQLYFSPGPMTGAMLAKKFLIKNKAAQMAMFAGATGATIKMVLGPYMDQVNHHWHELQSLLGIAQ
jgi:hypothetical protein